MVWISIDTKKAIITLVFVLIICAGLISYAYSIRPVENIYNVNVGNVNFKIHFNVSDLHIEESEEGAVHYFSDNGTVNVMVCDDGTGFSKSYYYTIEHECSNPTNLNGHVVYLTSSNMGDNPGETRYLSYINDRDNERLIIVSTGDMNETAYIISHIKVV